MAPLADIVKKLKSDAGKHLISGIELTGLANMIKG
jgi:hypothetical protein